MIHSPSVCGDVADQRRTVTSASESFVFVTRLKPGLGAAYDAFHRAIPEDLDATMRAAGVLEWRIYRNREVLTHRVVAVDRRAMSATLDADPINQSWQRQVDPYLVPAIPADASVPAGVPTSAAASAGSWPIEAAAVGDLVWDISWPTR